MDGEKTSSLYSHSTESEKKKTVGMIFDSRTSVAKKFLVTVVSTASSSRMSRKRLAYTHLREFFEKKKHVGNCNMKAFRSTFPPYKILSKFSAGKKQCVCALFLKTSCALITLQSPSPPPQSPNALVCLSLPFQPARGKATARKRSLSSRRRPRSHVWSLRTSSGVRSRLFLR